MARFESFIIEAIVLGLLVWQLISVRRDIRRAKAAEASKKAPADPG